MCVCVCVFFVALHSKSGLGRLFDFYRPTQWDTHTHTHKHTYRTPNEWLACRRGRYLHTKKTDTTVDHSCPHMDSKPRFQQPSSYRSWTYTSEPPGSAQGYTEFYSFFTDHKLGREFPTKGRLLSAKARGATIQMKTTLVSFAMTTSNVVYITALPVIIYLFSSAIDFQEV